MCYPARTPMLMPPRTPDFWYEARPTWAARALAPAAAAWALGHRAVQAWRARRAPFRAAHPVICVGGLTTGGSGKTPTALAIRALLGSGTFLTRGYGGRAAGPLLVDPARHTARDVGDEALLLAAEGPTIVARDRPSGARLARQGPIILDDGLLDPSLHQDVRLAVVDGAVGVGNGLTLPAGPLRARAAAALARCQALVIVGQDARAAASLAPPGLPVLRADLRVEMPGPGPVLAFAGIGRPDKFRAALLAAGADLVGFVPFADHHRYRPRDLERLRAAARAAGARLLTTAKDAVRLPPGFAAVARARLVFADPAAARRILP
jgi:tetraacyldisaccharide 4'-kinase